MNRLVTQPHRSNYSNPISFDVGERLVVGGRDSEEYPGWIWAQTTDGNAGWAPESILEIGNGDIALAKEAYTAMELDTNVGDEIVVAQELNGWYWVQNSRGEEGWIPIETTAALDR